MSPSHFGKASAVSEDMEGGEIMRNAQKGLEDKTRSASTALNQAIEGWLFLVLRPHLPARFGELLKERRSDGPAFLAKMSNLLSEYNIDLVRDHPKSDGVGNLALNQVVTVYLAGKELVSKTFSLELKVGDAIFPE